MFGISSTPTQDSHMCLKHYESQSEEQAVAEDEATLEDSSQTIMEVPNDLVPKVRELIAKRAI